MTDQLSNMTLNVQHNEFEKLISRTQRQAYNMAYRMTGNRDDAEDLTQEAYLRAYRSFDKYDRALPFENWFYKVEREAFEPAGVRGESATWLLIGDKVTDAVEAELRLAGATCYARADGASIEDILALNTPLAVVYLGGISAASGATTAGSGSYGPATTSRRR